VRFKLDDIYPGTDAWDSTEPFSVTWNTASTSAGYHQLKAEALDSTNTVALSAPVTVKVRIAGTR
jgi:hypothetical protein